MMLISGVDYVVQTNRFDVYEDFGCDLPHDMSILALFIVYIPPVIVSLGALICAGISLHGFINAHRRIRVRETLQSSQSGITTGLYLRFTIFSIIQMFYTITLTLFLLIISVIPGLNSWSDWDDVHADWQQIEQIARADIPQSSWNEYIFVWYMIPMSSLLFFAFFGLSQDARMEYVNFFRWIFRLKPKPASAPPTSAPRAENFYTTSLSFRTSPVAIIQTGTTELVTPAVHGAQDHMPASTSSRVPPPTIS
ncbi:Pheromone B beta 1 receptor [Ceratobasidium theobromae]|uniref:Pheromone B beta 1 receptor n=1 Tax=Ceratobasidium theobromae TaxID=1582974 RepID=A0A5N5QE47_9AGAM|nr:Pheromone B beta 1 receptor [Ceratobasidium theobromae]